MVTVSILSTILVLLIIVVGVLIYGIIVSNRDYYNIQGRNENLINEKIQLKSQMENEIDQLKREKKEVNSELEKVKIRYQDLEEKYRFLVNTNNELFVSYNFDDFEKAVTKLTDFQLANFSKNEMYGKFVCWEAVVNTIDEHGLVELKGSRNNLSSIKFTIQKSKDELLNYSKGDIIKVVGRLSNVSLNKERWGSNSYVGVEIEDAFIIHNIKSENETQIG